MDEGEGLGASEPWGAEEAAEGLGSVVAEGFAGDVGGDASVGEGLGGGDGGDVGACGAGVEQFAGLPGVEAFGGELGGEPGRVCGGEEGFGGEDASGLVVAVLSRVGGRVHGEDDVGAEGADDAHQFFQGDLLVPFAEGSAEALGVEEVLLIEEVDMADAEDAEGIAEFGFAEDAEGGTGLGADHVAAAFAAGGVGVGDDPALSEGVVGEGRGHAGFVVGVGEDGEDIGFEQGGALGRGGILGEGGDGLGEEDGEQWEEGSKGGGVPLHGVEGGRAGM